MKNHGKQIIDSKIVDKNYFGIDRNGVSHEKMACRMKRNIQYVCKRKGSRICRYKR